MTRTINIAIYAILIILMVSSAYAPNETKEQTKEKSPMEIQLMTIEKKIDDLVAWKDTTTKQLEEMSKHLDKIEDLIRTRCK